ncbi:hypothetical protein [Terriglobus sp. TAA 43]|uniref:hypothetical protein n=1 Tax=Terriglobus sp. TAA 43 TaxID=278961 RepID=UPI00068E243C|nr:hypothetical protein [Terriglobus sp. TAA 43]
MEEANLAIEQVGESASQPDVIEATAEESQEVAIAELDRRIRELESAMGEMHSVKASAATGRKTSASMMAKGADSPDMDAAFRSLSVEQRIAVKSGLIRAGLL